MTSVEWQIAKLGPDIYRLFKGEDYHGVTLSWYPTLGEIEAIFRGKWTMDPRRYVEEKRADGAYREEIDLAEFWEGFQKGAKSGAKWVVGASQPWDGSPELTARINEALAEADRGETEVLNIQPEVDEGHNWYLNRCANCDRDPSGKCPDYWDLKRQEEEYLRDNPDKTLDDFYGEM
jgi:hypothetical protein